MLLRRRRLTRTSAAIRTGFAIILTLTGQKDDIVEGHPSLLRGDFHRQKLLDTIDADKFAHTPRTF